MAKISFDPTTVKTDDRPAQTQRKFGLIPKGVYTGEVISSRHVPFNNDVGEGYSLDLKITEGEHEGRQLRGILITTRHNTSAQAQEIGQRKMAQLYEACGIVTAIDDTDELHHRTIQFGVIDDKKRKNPGAGGDEFENDINFYRKIEKPADKAASKAGGEKKSGW